LDLPGSSDSLVAAVGPAALLTLPPPGLPEVELRMDRFALRDVTDKLNQNMFAWPTRRTDNSCQP